MDLCEGGEKMLERLRAMKETSKMTNKDIANATGIPESTINKIFTGQSETKVELRYYNYTLLMYLTLPKHKK